VFWSHLQPSSPPRELYTKVLKHGFNHGIMICPYIVIKTVFVLLAVRMVAVLPETRNVIPSLKFNT